jgi:hypothetical protein
MMNTFQFISSFGGAGAPEDTENTEDEEKQRYRRMEILSTPWPPQLAAQEAPP